ncbi:Lipoprotein signal peptidase [Candidatus Providencia siddallii]|uniref:Lipoprotein signal peptidase n=1 Tax=Candidatus Providencia siddallii TaxID=1715285 RepID=A0A0M6W8Z7_9GAMM|nr:Lipoprotein signal peptidase [Candidatus Providencia siddallii]
MKIHICSTGLRFLWLIIIVIIIDLLIKQIILNTLNLYEQYNICRFFRIIYTQNFGIAFGFLASKNNLRRWFFLLVAISVSIILILILSTQDTKKPLINIAYSLIVGGAIGNISDRLTHGFVIDYFDFYIGDLHWPIFNTADVAICFGTTLIILDSFLSCKKE